MTATLLRILSGKVGIVALIYPNALVNHFLKESIAGVVWIKPST
jgi:hypothetical protein